MFDWMINNNVIQCIFCILWCSICVFIQIKYLNLPPFALRMMHWWFPSKICKWYEFMWRWRLHICQILWAKRLEFPIIYSWIFSFDFELFPFIIPQFRHFNRFLRNMFWSKCEHFVRREYFRLYQIDSTRFF